MAASSLKRRKIELLLDRVERLPTLPGIAHRVLPLVAADHPARRSIQQAVESDAALAARAVLLAVRQGALGARPLSIDAVLDAVSLEELVADLLAVEVVDVETLHRCRLTRLWRHTLAVGMASQVIASRLGTVPPEEALLAGILHDLGQIALPVLMPKTYAQVLERVATDGTDILEAERDLLDVDHAVLGKRLAQRWGFPEPLQNLMWLHHQSELPASHRTTDGPLIQIVHLADLVARGAGFGYQADEAIRENTAEVAERLGLSGVHADQIGRQVASAIDLNAGPIGLEDEPTPGQMWRVVMEANARLGRAYRVLTDRRLRLRDQARRADLLVRLNNALAACRSAREVLETVAETVRDTLGARLVVPYLLARGYEYIEGVVSSDPASPGRHFLYEVSERESLETLLADAPGAAAGPTGPVRAERAEAWLFERSDEPLGDGPFYTIPMIVEGCKVGGVVFALADAEHVLARQEQAELEALASMAGVALKRTQAEAGLVALTEEIAEVTRELEIAQEERLTRRNVASVSEMAAGAAHEINNPLAIISGRAQQLLQDETDDERRTFLETIVRQAGRASDLIRELHLFARPPTPEPEDFDPAALADELAEELRPRFDEAGVDFETETAADLPPIRADRVQVRTALANVLQNALEACADGGRVALLAQHLPAEEAVRFVVADNGPGMDPVVRARAFDPFYSGYEAGRHRGMGLPKAYRAVQANGGRMALDSTPGEGTTVRMTFGAAGATEAPRAATGGGAVPDAHEVETV